MKNFNNIKVLVSTRLYAICLKMLINLCIKLKTNVITKTEKIQFVFFFIVFVLLISLHRGF